MSDELTLFPGFDPPVMEPREDMSPDRRRTANQQQAISGGRHPLTGGALHPLASRHRDSDSPKSDPFTCGSCWFRTSMQYRNKTYAKCAADDGTRVTHGAASDVRAWWPACGDYSPGSGLSDDAARSVYPADEA